MDQAPAINSMSPRPFPAAVAAWSLHAWPTLLWQACHERRIDFQHVSTRIAELNQPVGGQTVWAGVGNGISAGLAWDWIEVTHGVVAMADPMSVITNVRLIGHAGEVLTAHQAARYLNEFVHRLPWQEEVRRALRERTIN